MRVYGQEGTQIAWWPTQDIGPFGAFFWLQPRSCAAFGQGRPDRARKKAKEIYVRGRRAGVCGLATGAGWLPGWRFTGATGFLKSNTGKGKKQPTRVHGTHHAARSSSRRAAVQVRPAYTSTPFCRICNLHPARGRDGRNAEAFVRSNRSYLPHCPARGHHPPQEGEGKGSGAQPKGERMSNKTQRLGLEAGGWSPEWPGPPSLQFHDVAETQNREEALSAASPINGFISTFVIVRIGWSG